MYIYICTYRLDIYVYIHIYSQYNIHTCSVYICIYIYTSLLVFTPEGVSHATLHTLSLHGLACPRVLRTCFLSATSSETSNEPQLLTLWFLRLRASSRAARRFLLGSIRRRNIKRTAAARSNGLELLSGFFPLPFLPVPESVFEIYRSASWLELVVEQNVLPFACVQCLHVLFVCECT
jgi:hypothetical protein